MTEERRVRIGTRGSPLALAQTHAVRDRLMQAHPHLAAAGAVEIVVIRTSGDLMRDRPLADIGGKGLFTKEIDEAMLAGGIDLAVHSAKDLPTWLADGIVLAALLPRGDPRDALIAPRAAGIADLPAGAVVGTASLRRQAQILARRPDLRVVNLRGNVHTRLRKAEEGAVEATLLALAGLVRLGLADKATAVLSEDEMLPAVGQAAIAITARPDNAGARHLLAALDDAATALEVAAERAMLAELDGSCRTPIAGLGRCGGDGTLTLSGLVARPDGSVVISGERRAPAADAAAIGADLGRELKARAGAGFFVA
jgi:hydroxymethylbilane synthase